ncbi:MAG: VCBS repeat-containing protein, partial [Chromatiales bacterium]|nr:VCBS repeat-containing protein [Chromatiales bacterium]
MKAIPRALLAVMVSIGCVQVRAEDISFKDVSDNVGMKMSGESYGASWGDLNGDGYPDLFVSMHRLKNAMFLNKRDGTFVDVVNQTMRWMTNPKADTHGGSWFDYDNDGDQDLIVAVGVGNPDQFFVNENGALIDRTQELGVVNTAWGGRLSTWMDYDNDGRPDFIMAQMGGIADLMHQNGDGTFTATTSDMRMVCRPYQYVQLLDVNNDGKLDVICPDNASYPQRVWNPVPSPWQNITSLVKQIPTTADTVIADFNNDGRPDIFLLSGVQTHPSGGALSGDKKHLEARLMGETKGFQFTSTGAVTFDMYQEGFGLPQVHIGSANFTPDNQKITLDPADPAVAGMPEDNGSTPNMRIGYDQDKKTWNVVMRSKTADGEQVWSEVYFVIDSTEEMSNLSVSGLWVTDRPARPTLLINTPSGFEDQTVAAGLADPIECVSVTAGDFDNDMNVDLFLVCRQATNNIANILLRNRGDGTFERVKDAGGAAGPIGLAVREGAGTGESVAIADYDLDGFLDVFVTNGLNLSPVGVG